MAEKRGGSFLEPIDARILAALLVTTSAVAIARRIPSVGRVAVSERRSITPRMLPAGRARITAFALEARRRGTAPGATAGGTRQSFHTGQSGVRA